MLSKADGLFLQAMLLEHVVNEPRAKEIYRKCVEQYPPQSYYSLEDAIIKMSASPCLPRPPSSLFLMLFSDGNDAEGLGRLHLGLKWQRSEDVPCSKHLVLINLSNDEIATKFGFGTHANQLDEQKKELLKHLLTAIAKNEGVLEESEIAVLGRRPQDVHHGEQWSSELPTMSGSQVRHHR